jgi:hypothetical protein
LCLLALAALGCAPPRQVWFTPNLGSPDLLDLFAHPEAWPLARSRVDVFKLYEVQLLEDQLPCPACGPNRLSGLRRVGAFDRLREWRIDVAIEMAAIKSWDCRGELALPLARQAIQAVRASNGDVRHVALDEPLLGASECGLADGEALRRTAAFLQAVRAGNPDLDVGDIEPYPAFSAERLVAWLRGLRDAGEAPAFFHLDVDRAAASRFQSDVVADMKTLRSACASDGIAFGVILWGDDASSDQAYAESVLGWTRTVADTFGGFPEHTLFQSWVTSADGAQRAPLNLPEGDPAAYSHTRLINEGFELLRATQRARMRPATGQALR